MDSNYASPEERLSNAIKNDSVELLLCRQLNQIHNILEVMSERQKNTEALYAHIAKFFNPDPVDEDEDDDN